jgi:hypothetical protein
MNSILLEALKEYNLDIELLGKFIYLILIK